MSIHIEIYGKVTIYLDNTDPPDITLEVDPDPGEEIPEKDKPNLKAVARKRKVNE